MPDAAHLVDSVAEVCAREGLQADDRLPLLERLHRLLADSPSGAEIPLHGMWGVAVPGLAG